METVKCSIAARGLGGDGVNWCSTEIWGAVKNYSV